MLTNAGWPCLHALRSTYPDARITYIGKQWHADFLANRPGPVDDVAVLPPCRGLGLLPDADIDLAPAQRFVDDMRASGIDIALQVYGGGLYSNPFIMQLGARLTVGMTTAL